jgi:CheY-like chemotaxis protein
MARVLIVDDEVTLVANIAAFLNSYPDEFEVVTALSGEDGLAALLAGSFDVLVSDVRLPGIDGIELVRRALAIRPELRVVVMTAYGSTELHEVALREGALRFVEKPIDLGELRLLLHQLVDGAQGWSGMVGDLDLFDVAQLLAMSGRTKVVRVSCGAKLGVLGFKGGRLVHASAGDLAGEDAFYAMAVWEGGSFEDLSGRPAKRFTANVSLPTTQLMMEAARLRDESRVRTAPTADRPAAAGLPSPDQTTDVAGIIDDIAAPAPPAPRDAGRQSQISEDTHMAIKDHLNELQTVSGFLAAAVFSPQGDLLEGFANNNMDIKSVGMFANNALLNAQKATDQMGVGRGNRMQIRAPQATVVMRCLNEATDFSASATGKAHFHTVVVMDPDGNVGMASMILDKVVGKIADEVR